MVIKLIKNEIKETFRSFVPVFGMTLIGGVLTLILGLRLRSIVENRLTPSTGSDLMLGMGVLLIYALLIASIVLTIRSLLMIIYHSLYKKNAYRVFTYPVSSTQLFASKVITVMFWSFVSGAIIALVYITSFMLIFNGMDIFSVVGEVFGEIGKILFGSQNPMGVFLYCLSMLVNSVVTVAFILFAGSVANSSYIRKGRGFATFMILLGIWIVTSIVNNMIMPSSAFTLTSSYSMPYGLLDNSAMLLSILRDLLFITVASAGTIWMWNNKLEILN